MPATTTPNDSRRRREQETLGILSEVAQIAAQDLEFRPMLQRIAEALAARFHWEHVGIASIDDDPPRFVCEAVVSAVPSAVYVGYSRELGSGVVGTVAASGTTILLDDVGDWPGYIETLPGARSELCLPIKHRGRVVAVLNIESQRPAALGRHLPLVEAVAEQVSGAIAVARLDEEIKRRGRSLEILSEIATTVLETTDLDALIERIARFVQHRFGFLVVAILVADESGKLWKHRALITEGAITFEDDVWPIDRGVIGRAVRLGQPQLVLDIGADSDYVAALDAVRCEYVVPIAAQGAILGAFNIESDRAELLGSETLAVLRMIANQVSGAIRLARLNRQLVEARGLLEDSNRQLQAANGELEELSLRDPLTGLPNRRRLDQALDAEWRRAVRTGGFLALLVVDIDYFKNYNDRHGHPTGDDCLRRVADALSRHLQRAGDLVARYGGEEFAILLPSLDYPAALRLAETLRAAVEALNIPHGSSLAAPSVTISVGVAAMTPRPGASPGELVAVADAALYVAKAEGRNLVRSA